METLSWSTIGEGGARGGKMAAAAAAALALVLVLVLVRVVVLVLVPGPRSSLLGRGAGGGAGAVPALAGVCVGAGAGAIQSIQPTSSEVSPGLVSDCWWRCRWGWRVRNATGQLCARKVNCLPMARARSSPTAERRQGGGGGRPEKRLESMQGHPSSSGVIGPGSLDAAGTSRCRPRA